MSIFNRALLIAGMRLGIPEALTLMRPSAPPMPRNAAFRGRFRSGGARGDKSRLHLDRSSSVKKLQRWLNNGEIERAPLPTEQGLLRHAWYRREKERAARAAATEAWNNG